MTTFTRELNETLLQIDRENGQCVQYSVARGPLVGNVTRFAIFVILPEDENEKSLDMCNFANAPLQPVEGELEANLQEVELSVEEARLLRDFLNRPEIVALLDRK